jgi:hypothetical protein
MAHDGLYPSSNVMPKTLPARSPRKLGHQLAHGNPPVAQAAHPRPLPAEGAEPRSVSERPFRAPAVDRSGDTGESRSPYPALPYNRSMLGVAVVLLSLALPATEFWPRLPGGGA